MKPGPAAGLEHFPMYQDLEEEEEENEEEEKNLRLKDQLEVCSFFIPNVYILNRRFNMSWKISILQMMFLTHQSVSI